MGTIFCLFISLIVPTYFLIDLFETQGGWGRHRPAAAAGLLASVPLGGYCIYLVVTSLARDPTAPVGLVAALRQAAYPRPLRPVVAAYWLTHFLIGAGIGFAVSVDRHAQGHAHGHPVPPAMDYQVGPMAKGICLAFGFLYAANVYLLLAVTAFGPRERLARTLWRRRIVIDLAVAMAAAVASSGRGYSGPLWLQRLLQNL